MSADQIAVAIIGWAWYIMVIAVLSAPDHEREQWLINRAWTLIRNGVEAAPAAAAQAVQRLRERHAETADAGPADMPVIVGPVGGTQDIAGGTR